MIREILSWTELPNLHPALVHFPIALVALALLFELGGVLGRRPEWLDRAATTTWTAAALGAWAAWWAGRRAADSLAVPPAIQGHLNTHSDWGLYTLWTVAAVATLRLAVGLWRTAPRDGRLWPALFLTVGMVAFGVVARTADLGGGLVFRHGLAVRTQADREHLPKSDGTERHRDGGDEIAGAGSDAAPALRVEADGSRIWTPGGRAATGIGTILTSLGGGAPPGLSASAGAPGLILEIDGSGLALLEAPCGDVQVEAEVAFGAFEGSFGLAHHISDDGSGGLFTLTVPSARANLSIREGGEVRTLDNGESSSGAGPMTLAVSGAGRHFRGLIDGELVAHAHQTALPDGRCGLYYDGVGSVRLIALRAIPVE